MKRPSRPASVEHPMQPLVVDPQGVVRFKANGIIRHLFDSGIMSLNDLARLPHLDSRDWEQLAQLLGYSVSGFGDLSYARAETVAEADRLAARLVKATKRRASS